jgi:hypothetical protein
MKVSIQRHAPAASLPDNHLKEEARWVLELVLEALEKIITFPLSSLKPHGPSQ